MQLVLAFDSFSLEKKKRWTVVLEHVFALNPTSVGVEGFLIFPKAAAAVGGLGPNSWLLFPKL